jgi:CDP-diacylglycerol--glycerol-3-phosphate 3-phosphatidyltransferase
VRWDGYAERWSELHGGYDPRRASTLVRGWLRLAYEISRQLAKTPIGPGTVTTAGLVLSAAVPLVAWPGGAWLPVSAVLVVLAALADTVDGALAVVTGRTSRLGQVYDSVADRLAEAAWLVALLLAGAPAWLAAMGGISWLHEYVRARATVAGMAEVGTVTVAERPTRVIVTAFGLAAMAGWAATVATAVWVVLGGIGLIQLHAAVRRALRPDR